MSDDIEYLDEEIAALGGPKESLRCDECGLYFEVSPDIAESMRAWEEEAGDPICCSDCSGEAEVW